MGSSRCAFRSAMRRDRTGGDHRRWVCQRAGQASVRDVSDPGRAGDKCQLPGGCRSRPSVLKSVRAHACRRAPGPLSASVRTGSANGKLARARQGLCGDRPGGPRRGCETSDRHHGGSAGLPDRARGTGDRRPGAPGRRPRCPSAATDLHELAATNNGPDGELTIGRLPNGALLAFYSDVAKAARLEPAILSSARRLHAQVQRRVPQRSSGCGRRPRRSGTPCRPACPCKVTRRRTRPRA
jgi:hypothetical protein